MICQNSVYSLVIWLSSQKKSINVTHQKGVLVVIIIVLLQYYLYKWTAKLRILDSVHIVVDKPIATLRQMSGKPTQHQNLHHGPSFLQLQVLH